MYKQNFGENSHHIQNLQLGLLEEADTHVALEKDSLVFGDGPAVASPKAMKLALSRIRKNLTSKYNRFLPADERDRIGRSRS